MLSSSSSTPASNRSTAASLGERLVVTSRLVGLSLLCVSLAALLGAARVTPKPAVPPSSAPFPKEVSATLLGREATPLPAPSKPPLTLLFVGDLMFDRAVWSKMTKYGLSYPFEQLGHFLADADLTIGNLEGPITSRGEHAVANGPLLFTFEPAIAPILKTAGFDLLSLANNHTLNQGAAGLTETRAFLAEQELGFFGDPRRLEAEVTIKTIETGSWTIGFVGWNTIEVAETGEPAVLALVQDLTQRTDFVIVYPHWGPEYQPQSREQVRQAHALIESGADLVIGAHPHVVQGIELFAGKPIIYSLGNFVFDQYWSRATEQGLAVKLVLSEAELNFELLPIDLARSQPRLADGDVATAIIDRITSASDAALAEAIRSKTLTISWPDRPR